MTRFGAALSQHPLPAEAVGEVLGEVLEQVGVAPDLAVLFVTGPLVGALEDIAAAVRTLLQPGLLLGTTAVSVVGGDREVEEQSAVTLWAGSVGPTVGIRLDAPSHFGHGSPEAVLASLPAEEGSLLLLADPFSFPVGEVLDVLAAERPEITVIGGLASAGRGPGGNRLVLDDAQHTDGAVGVYLSPGCGLIPVVSQGCRPIGDPMVVTKAERNVIYELAGQPALDRLTSLVERVGAAERAMLAQGIHLGVVVDEHHIEFGRGDFLVRNVLGADHSIGAVAVGDVVDVGTTVQFQVRDADTADEDLRLLLADAGPAEGALVFTCNGRGTNLFGRPNHDAELVAGVAGVATAGMFCAGEVGPIGNRSFLHGFTASVALFL